MNRFASALVVWVVLACATYAPAQPAITPDLAVMNLDELGVYSVGYAYRGQPEQQFPLGWYGFFEDRTGVACEPFGTQNGKSAFLLHCPWRNGTGITFQQFVFKLPAQASRILLRGATAMRSENVTNSDGVTFRLYVNGTKLFDYHQTNDIWQAFEYDFTSLRGSNLTVRFEVDPGPNNNASFDYSLWGDRQLVLEGYMPASITRLPPPPLALSNLWSGQIAGVAPPSGFAGTSSANLSNGIVRFRYGGDDGVLEYQWSPPQSANDALYGTILLNAQMTGDTPVSIPLGNTAAFSWTQAATYLSSAWSQNGAAYTLSRTFTVGSVTTTVRMTGELAGKTLSLTVTYDQPNVASFNAGLWGPVVRRRQVPTPYYSGAVQYLDQEGMFVNAQLDWTASSASSHNGTIATYDALTDGTRLPLRERILFTAAWHLDEVLPNPPNPASPWRDFLSNKIVLDIWGGTFTNIANNLAVLADYGITNCVALIHDWQRSGYDNALPAHYPANASYGGDPGMSNLVATAARVGIRCALHENYVDYYPNYDFYNTNDIAQDSSGQLELAWYNPGTHIQSFAEKPNSILTLAATQSPEIHRRYATQANYLDVHSAVPPWFHVDHRVSENGAGQFGRVWDVHRQLWAYERATHTGPVFGEGNAHWYWSGCLDGVEAQFGSGWPGNGGFSAPFAVDFDLLKIHPLQLNHGMGYYSRWWPNDFFQTNWAGGPAPMVVLDRYRAQEVAFGHAGFLDSSIYANVPLAWLEHHLLSPVMARYGNSRPLEIQYECDGAWLDATAIARLSSDPTNNRVRIRYESGLLLTVNGTSNMWTVGSTVLPDWGWSAEGPGLSAGTSLRNGVVSDFLDSGTNVFLNARPASDWNLTDYRRVHPSVGSFQQTAARAFQVTYRWDVNDTLPQNYTAFVHFCTNGVIRAQQDHSVSPPTSQWQLGQAVSDGPWNVTLSTSLPDADYDWLIGLYDPSTGSRVHLQGIDDGTARIRLGILRVANLGNTLTFFPETNSPVSDPTWWYSQHLNNSNSVVDFGVARTDGSAWLSRQGNLWRLKTWPRSRNFTLEFNSSRFEYPLVIQCLGGTAAQVTPVSAGSRWRLPLNGAREYQWTNSSPRLSIIQTNNGVIISWPLSGAGFSLETADELSPSGAWVASTNPVQSSTDQFSVLVLPSSDRQFHRLRLQ